MKKFSLSITALLLSLVLTACNNKPEDDTPPIEPDPVICKAKDYEYNQSDLDYELVWSDEFDYEGAPDSTKWNINGGGGGFGNNEEQYYKPDNLLVKDGVFTITANNDGHNRYEYTSGKIDSRSLGDFTYGKIEVRAKIPEGRGTWPAIWMLPTYSSYGTWPASGEIDIMEHVGYDMYKIHGTVHTGLYNHKRGTQKGGSITIDDATTEFHTYTIEWLPDKIEWYVDDELYYTFEPSKLVSNGCPNEKSWPFDKPFYLIMNIAIGGDWGGLRGIDDSIFPQTLQVDYVRVYQSDEITNLEQKVK